MGQSQQPKFDRVSIFEKNDTFKKFYDKIKSAFNKKNMTLLAKNYIESAFALAIN